MYPRFEESEDDICGINLETRSDACKGDSGGPLMYKSPADGRWYLAGVVSRGWTGCGKSDLVPGIYTSIYPYLGNHKKGSWFKESCAQ